MSWDYLDSKKLKSLVKQISGTITEKDGELVPYHAIKGKGTIWCYHPVIKTMVKIQRGINIFVLDSGTAEDKKCLALTGDGIVFTIDKNEIYEIGFD